MFRCCTITFIPQTWFNVIFESFAGIVYQFADPHGVMGGYFTLLAVIVITVRSINIRSIYQYHRLRSSVVRALVL